MKKAGTRSTNSNRSWQLTLKIYIRKARNVFGYITATCVLFSSVMVVFVSIFGTQALPPLLSEATNRVDTFEGILSTTKDHIHTIANVTIENANVHASFTGDLMENMDQLLKEILPFIMFLLPTLFNNSTEATVSSLDYDTQRIILTIQNSTSALHDDLMITDSRIANFSQSSHSDISDLKTSIQNLENTLHLDMQTLHTDMQMLHADAQTLHADITALTLIAETWIVANFDLTSAIRLNAQNLQATIINQTKDMLSAIESFDQRTLISSTTIASYLEHIPLAIQNSTDILILRINSTQTQLVSTMSQQTQLLIRELNWQTNICC